MYRTRISFEDTPESYSSVKDFKRSIEGVVDITIGAGDAISRPGYGKGVGTVYFHTLDLFFVGGIKLYCAIKAAPVDTEDNKWLEVCLEVFREEQGLANLYMLINTMMNNRGEVGYKRGQKHAKEVIQKALGL